MSAAALLAQEVPVDGARQVVGGRAVTEVRVHDDAEALELIEVAIDGREVDVGVLRLHLGGQLFGCPVTAGGEECPEQNAP